MDERSQSRGVGEDPHGGVLANAEDGHRHPMRRRPRMGWWLLGPALCSIGLAALVLPTALDGDDGPRELHVDAPSEAGDAPPDAGPSDAAPPDAGLSDAGLSDELHPTPEGDAAIIEVVRGALDPEAPVEARALRIETAPSGRPPVSTIVASFDGLAASSGADMRAATMAVTHPANDIAFVTVDVPLNGEFGDHAQLRDVMLRRTAADRWLMTYESICALGNLSPLAGGSDACRADPSMHLVDGAADLATMLGDDTHRRSPSTPTILAYDTYNSVRTGDWAWLVDYPDAELGGGMPSTPAELVRVDVRTGIEDGRVRLPGTNPHLAADGDRLWVLETPIGPDGTWLDPVLTLVRTDDLVATPGPAVPAGAMTIAASAGSLWVATVDGVSRHDQAGRLRRTWAATDLGDVQSWMSTTPVATPVGLWLPSTDASTPVQLLPADDAAIVHGPTGVRELVPAGDGVWAAPVPPGEPLRRIDPDGTIGATVASPPLPVDGSAWSDGDGGLWLTGSSIPEIVDYRPMSFSVTSRPVATHLGRDGDVLATWWATGSSPQGSGWFARFGDRLGWIDLEGARLLTP